MGDKSAQYVIECMLSLAASEHEQRRELYDLYYSEAKRVYKPYELVTCWFCGTTNIYQSNGKCPFCRHNV